MPSWANNPLQLFHGTHSNAMASYRPLTLYSHLTGFVVNLSLCDPRTDFGQGFYTTTSAHQARQWANQQVRRALHRAPPIATQAIVLSFQVSLDWLASQECLTFVRPTSDYYNFTTSCRHGLRPHQRVGAKPNYDVVFGPVRLWPQDLVVHDCDQVSFHDPKTVVKLPVPQVFEVGDPTTGLL